MKIFNNYEVLFLESLVRVGIEFKKGEVEGFGECGRKIFWDL